MLFFVIALPAEAKALIKHYALTRIEPSPFPLYQNANTVLIVSGMGRDQALTATTYLLTRYGTTDTDVLVNLGICAAANVYDIGQTLIPHTLKEYQSNRNIFPDLRFSHPYKEVLLTTFETPQEESGTKTESADMEAYYIAKAALNFLSTAQLFFAKTVSDHFSAQIPSKEDVNRWMQELMVAVAPLIDCYTAQKSTKIHYSQPLEAALLQLQTNLQLTQTQIHQLNSTLNYYLLRHQQEPLLPKYIATTHKKEQKDAFNKLLSLLAS